MTLDRQRKRRLTDRLIAAPAERGNVDRVGAVSSSFRQPCNRRFAHVIVVVGGELFEDAAVAEHRGGARGVHPQLPRARSDELGQGRSRLVRRRSRQRHERMRHRMPSSRRTGAAAVVDRALEESDGVCRC